MSLSGAVPASGQSRHVLISSMGVNVIDFRCCAHVERLGGEEPNPTHSIVFVRRGVFMRRDREGELVADPNHILFFNRDEPYRYAHPLAGGDDCTILTVEDDVARAAAERLKPARASDTPGPFTRGFALITPRAARLHHDLLVACGGGSPTLELALQDLLAELVDEAMAALGRANTAHARRSSRQDARRRDTVEAAKLHLTHAVGCPPSLSVLAAALDCSPFHLSRIFRATTGLSLRQYLRRLRAQIAAERLRRGDRDLTSLALELGFYDHSHFTKAFRREWGVPPSQVRSPERTRKYKRANTPRP